MRFVAAFAAIIFAVVASAQVTTSSIGGRVSDADGVVVGADGNPMVAACERDVVGDDKDILLEHILTRIRTCADGCRAILLLA